MAFHYDEVIFLDLLRFPKVMAGYMDKCYFLYTFRDRKWQLYRLHEKVYFACEFP